MRRIWLAALLLAIVSTPLAAQTDGGPSLDAEQLFEQATDAVGEGELEAAAELLERASKVGEGRIAAEALFLLGELYEEQLDNPGRARAVYQRIITKHPQQGVAVAARRRLATLETLLGEDDGDRLGRFLAIRRRETDSQPSESLAAAEALLTEDPEWISTAHVRLWMAGVALRDGQKSRAEALYREALSSSDPDVVFEARLAASELARDRGAFAEALEIAKGIDPGGLAGRLQARTDAVAAIERAQVRSGWADIAMVVVFAVPLLLLSLVAWRRRSLRAFGRALWPPPTETIYLIPVLGVFLAASYTGHMGIAAAVLVVSIAGVLASWVAGAALRVLPRSWLASIGVALGAVLTVTSAFYIALVRGGLVDLIISTVRLGPDV